MPCDQNATPELGDSTPLFQRLNVTSLSERIRDQILEMIADRRLEAGDRLPPEREIARQLGVGRPTVREALAALSLINVVDVRPGSGAYVATLEVDRFSEPIQWIFALSRSSIDELFDARVPLEVHAARLAAARHVANDAGQLELIIDEMATPGLSSPSAMEALDRRFHVAIAKLSGNRLLVEFVEVVNRLASKSRQESFALVDRERSRMPGTSSGGHRAVVLSEHRAIAVAIAAADPDGAEAAMRSHLRTAALNLVSVASETSSSDGGS